MFFDVKSKPIARYFVWLNPNVHRKRNTLPSGPNLKTTVLMKICLTKLFLLLALLQVNGKSFAQISLDMEEAPLEHVLLAIEKQSGYFFFYDSRDIYSTVSVKLNNASIEEALNETLKNLPLTYRINNKEIYIRKVEEKKPIKQPVQHIQIRGVVTDSLEKPLAGATVRIGNNRSVVTSNREGVFSFALSVSDGLLSVSMVGYTTIQVPLAVLLNEKPSLPEGMRALKNRDGTINLRVTLARLTSQLDETVVIGYGMTTRRLNTGSVARITTEDISKQPLNNPLQAMQGRMAGVQIQQSSGITGGGYTIRIRGNNSLRTNGNEPLYIIDNVIFPSNPIGSTLLNTGIIGGGSPLSTLNSADIESIEVLKDADATAIYGSRGANGVVLITTKKGVSKKTSINFHSYGGFGKINNKMDLLNTDQYLVMRNEAFRNDGESASINNAPDLLLWDTSRYTDWQKTLIGGTAPIWDAQLSLSGGNDETQFSIRTGYHREGTVFPGSASDSRISTHLNLGHVSPNKRFSTNFSGSYMSNTNNLPRQDFTSIAYGLPPNAPPIYDTNGELNWEQNTFQNPFGELQKRYNSINKNLIGNIQVQYEIAKNLHAKASFGYNRLESDESTINPQSSFNPAYNQERNSMFSNATLESWIVEPQLNYTVANKWGKMDVLLGAALQKSQNRRSAFEATGFLNDNLLENISAASNVTALGNAYVFTDYKYAAIFGRLSYALKNKYLFNITARRDGSSRFGPNRRFANFGALGMAWIFTNEKGIENMLPFLSYGKLRASYGITGNDQIEDYGYLNTYSLTRYPYQNSSIYPSRLDNSDYGWETNKKLESALDLGFFKDRFLLTLGFYRNRSSNQLVGYPLPLTTGFASVQFNLPATVQNQGFEFELNAMTIKKSNLTWKTSLNLTIPRTKLVSYPNIEGSPYANTYIVGESLYVRKRFHVTGVNPETGLYEFEDIDSDGRVSSPNDLQGRKAIEQKWFSGINNIIQYKSFQFDFLIQLVNQSASNYFLVFPSPGSLGNQPLIVMDRWQKPGDETTIQKFSQSFINEAYTAFTSNQFNGDASISQASFVRFKSFSLSYTIPSRICQALKVSNASLFFQGQNVFTVSDFLGYDPETQGSRLPPLRSFVFGINLNL